jgi:lysophospholipase
MQLFRLTSSFSSASSSSASGYPRISSRSLSAKARDVTASWAPTDSDTVQTYNTILPFLIHVAAAKNDGEGIQFCMDAWDELAKLEDRETPFGSPVLGKSFLHSGSGVGSGICNVLDTSGRSPLHTATLNGSLESARLLLENGASVHSRDLLDHTVLYYVSDQAVRKHDGDICATYLTECTGHAARS